MDMVAIDGECDEIGTSSIMKNHNIQRRCSFRGPFSVFKICLLLAIPLLFFLITKVNYIDNSMPFALENMLKVGASLETLQHYADSERFTSTCRRELLHKMETFARYNRTVLIPLPQNTTCPRQLGRPQDPHPSTALLSFPGSGNTWSRHLLQQMTGFYTGSIYKDRRLAFNGFPLEGFVKRVIVVKTHGALHSHVRHYVPVNKFDRVILILRNVYECILSETRRLLRGNSHTATIRVNTTTFPWKSLLMTYLQNWEQFMREAFTFRGPLLVIFYGDLKSKLLPELIRMAEFLRYEDLTEFSFCCVLQEQEGAFHRRPNNQTTKDVYSQQDRIIVNRYIQRIALSLQKTHPNVSDRLLSHMMAV